MQLIGSTIYKNKHYASIETKLRSFQIRLNLRSNVTNMQLYVLDTDSDNLCTFCREEAETLTHLFRNFTLLVKLSKVNLT